MYTILLTLFFFQPATIFFALKTVVGLIDDPSAPMVMSTVIVCLLERPCWYWQWRLDSPTTHWVGVLIWVSSIDHMHSGGTSGSTVLSLTRAKYLEIFSWLPALAQTLGSGADQYVCDWLSWWRMKLSTQHIPTFWDWWPKWLWRIALPSPQILSCVYGIPWRDARIIASTRTFSSAGVSFCFKELNTLNGWCIPCSRLERVTQLTPNFSAIFWYEAFP